MMFPEYVEICPKGVFQKEIIVTEEQMDGSGFMGIGDLARQMEKITEAHLGLFGVDRESLNEEGKIWVIAWTAISIRRMPKSGEKILLRIWPCKRKSVLYPRKYAFYSREGEPLACASSLFILMDRETRSASGPSEKMQRIPVVTIPGEPKLPQMQMQFPETFAGKIERTVQPDEIDKNGHLNNTCYLDWAVQLSERLGLQDQIPDSVWVEYTKELLLGQKVTLNYQKQGESLFICGYADKEKCFSIRIDYL